MRFDKNADGPSSGRSSSGQVMCSSKNTLRGARRAVTRHECARIETGFSSGMRGGSSREGSSSWENPISLRSLPRGLILLEALATPMAGLNRYTEI